MYKPKYPFNVPAKILNATTTKINGVIKKTYTDGDNIFISAKSYGGTEKVINDKYVIEDTMEVDTWYHPAIKSDCHIRLLDDDSEWELLNSPEDIDRMHRYMKFKIRKVGGKA